MYSNDITPEEKAILDQIPNIDYFARKLSHIDPMGPNNPINSDLNLSADFDAAQNTGDPKDLQDFLNTDPRVMAYRKKYQLDWASLEGELLAAGGLSAHMSDLMHAIHYGKYIIQDAGITAKPQTPNSP